MMRTPDAGCGRYFCASRSVDRFATMELVVFIAVVIVGLAVLRLVFGAASTVVGWALKLALFVLPVALMVALVLYLLSYFGV